MKIISSLIFIIAIFTGCTNTSSPLKKEPLKQKSEKQILIQKANNSDIKAMVELNKIYLFPQTKEGFDLYKKWYKLVLQSDDLDHVLEFIAVFQKYQDMFINGKEKVYKLKEHAIKLGSQETLYKLFIDYYRAKNQKAKKRLINTAIKNLEQNQLITLRNMYLFNRMKTKADELQKYITKTDKEYFDSLSLKDKIYYLHKIYIQRREKGKEYDRIVKESINSDDSTLISAIGKLLFKNGRWHKALSYLEKAAKSNTTDAKIYFDLASTYEALDYSRNRYKDEITTNLKKATLLDSYEATKELLELYKKNRDEKEYLELKKELLKLNESKRALAEFFYKSGRYFEAYELFAQLAQSGNDTARVRLASDLKTALYNTPIINPERDILIDKWREYILKMDQPYLRAKLKKELIYKEDKELKEKIVQIELKENNIQTLKDIAKTKYGNLATPYLQKASNFGDIEAKYLLAKQLNYHDKEGDKKIAIYEELIKQGDPKAYKELAKAYEINNFKPQPKKILYYYEKAYESGDKTVINKIVSYYICPKCKMLNEEKVKYYVNEAIKDKNYKLVYELANSYKLGINTTKNLKKAEYYYKKAFELGESQAYYDLGMLYKKEYKNNKKAFEYIKKCADTNKNNNCIIQLGIFYDLGIGIKKDTAKAIEIYKSAANFNKIAAFNLGVIYFNKKDYVSALKYFKMSERIGYKKSAEIIGRIYQKGLGVEKNLTIAKIWYKRANTQKAKKEIQKIDRLLKK